MKCVAAGAVWGHVTAVDGNSQLPCSGSGDVRLAECDTGKEELLKPGGRGRLSAFYSTVDSGHAQRAQTHSSGLERGRGGVDQKHKFTHFANIPHVAISNGVPPFSWDRTNDLDSTRPASLSFRPQLPRVGFCSSHVFSLFSLTVYRQQCSVWRASCVVHVVTPVQITNHSPEMVFSSFFFHLFYGPTVYRVK